MNVIVHMLYHAKNIKGWKLKATDGEIGHVKDLYFTNSNWLLRYVIVDTGNWLPGRKVLIPTHELNSLDAHKHQLQVDLNMQQIKNSPPIEMDKPVSRQFEETYYSYYGWSHHWIHPSMAGAAIAPGGLITPATPTEVHSSDLPSESNFEETANPNLHSFNEVCDYRISAQDGEIGHLDDLLIASEDWTIQYLVIDTQNWLPGRKVVVAPGWVQDFSWIDKVIRVDHTRQEIEEAPEYDPENPISTEYEQQLYKHYGRAEAELE